MTSAPGDRLARLVTGDPTATAASVEAGANDAIMEALDEQRPPVRHEEDVDEYGIPTGEHFLVCTCKMRGRALLVPCAEHRGLTAPGPVSHDPLFPLEGL